jgi:hypothetical protein
MSSSKLDKSGVFEPLTVRTSQTQLSLPPDAVKFQKNGIEFLSAKPIPAWKEMTVEVQSPSHPRKARFTGVVVGCNGNRHMGYVVSMLFTNLTRQSQEQLNELTLAGS